MDLHRGLKLDSRSLHTPHIQTEFVKSESWGLGRIIVPNHISNRLVITFTVDLETWFKVIANLTPTINLHMFADKAQGGEYIVITPILNRRLI